MITLPVIRGGAPYASLETADVVHFHTGEPVARVGQANGGLLLRDLRRSDQARASLRDLGPAEILRCCERAADLFLTSPLPMGIDGELQSISDYVHMQSASTGLPEHMCQTNMQKIAFVLENMSSILDALTRGLDLEILARGYGQESRGVTVSYLPQSPVLAAVLPSNSPGVHTLWLPALPLMIGLVLKPGSSEPWTPYRVAAAFLKAGLPPAAIGIYPGDHDVGNAILSKCRRAMIFGSEKTVEQYAGNPRVQVHGPGFSKILLGDDVVDCWPDYLDLMEESILSNGGRSCVNCSTIVASRHTTEIARALAERLGPVDAQPPTHPGARLAAFTSPEIAGAIWSSITSDLAETGVTHVTEPYGDRLIRHERCAYLRPIVVLCDSMERRIALKEFMFPFCVVVSCPQKEMLPRIGPTLVATAITADERFIAQLVEASHVDRLNIGPIPTNRLNWLQPHEGNLVDFLYRSRACQIRSDLLDPPQAVTNS